MTGFGLDGLGIGVRFLTIVIYISHSVQTGCMPHPASYPISNGDCFSFERTDEKYPSKISPEI
jgi:hypothetical protein